MATFNPTPSQQRAIDDRGKNILVSASAGSGKTAVLVERAIKLIREGIHVDGDLYGCRGKEYAG